MNRNPENRLHRGRRADPEGAAEFLFVVLRLILACSMFRCDRCRHGLRYEIFLFTGHAVVKRPAMHRWKLFSKITMSRRRRHGPFQGGRMPRVAFGGTLTCKDADEEIRQEDQLRRSQNERGDRDEYVHGLLGHKEHVLSWIVDAPHLAADSDDVHWEENTVNTNEREPEVNLSQGLVHEAAKHF